MAVSEDSLNDMSVSSEASPESAPGESQVIHQAWIEAEVQDIETAVTEVTDIVHDVDGRIDHRSIQRGETEEVSSASLQLRVPKDTFTEVITALGEVGTIRHENTNAHDVTVQHLDLTTRVSSLSGSISRLEALVEEATSVADLIEVETALADRQAELDSLTAQLDLLTDEVQYATIDLNLNSAKSPVAGGNTSFIEAITAGFWSIVTALNGLFIGAGYVLPWVVFVGIIALIIWGVFTAVKRRR